MKERIRVGIIYGGQSVEQEVSQASACEIVKNLDPARYIPIPISINNSGQWQITLASLDRLDLDKGFLSLAYPESIPFSLTTSLSGNAALPFDVAFPIVHGTKGEDGALQGLFELLNVPYAGCGVTGSAICMDKALTKTLITAAKIPTVQYLSYTATNLQSNRHEILDRVISTLGFPLYAKPACLGSSVGIRRVETYDELNRAVDTILQLDLKLIFEEALLSRDIEISAMEDTASNAPRLSSIGEIQLKKSYAFYSYKAKYLDSDSAILAIPSPLTSSETEQVKTIASQVWQCLGCDGFARIDFLLEKTTGKVYFNEINTLPGFTKISMYPKLWEHTGLPKKELITELIELGIRRYQIKSQLKTITNDDEKCQV